MSRGKKDLVIDPSWRIRPLEVVFERRGVRYEQLEKNGEYVVYRCTDRDMSRPYYELFAYRLCKPHPLDKGGWDMVEVYPGDTAFGVTAWCCSTEGSLRRMLELHFGVKRGGEWVYDYWLKYLN